MEHATDSHEAAEHSAHHCQPESSTTASPVAITPPTSGIGFVDQSNCFADAIQTKKETPNRPEMHPIALSGLIGTSQPLPHLDVIQRSFGRHKIGHIRAHLDSNARSANREMGAIAYTLGSHVAFRSSPDLHTAAHEAAHVVQQARGVHINNGVGQPGDRYERQADAAADLVVQGRSAEGLLGDTVMTPAGGSDGALQFSKLGADTHTFRRTGTPILPRSVLNAIRKIPIVRILEHHLDGGENAYKLIDQAGEFVSDTGEFLIEISKESPTGQVIKGILERESATKIAENAFFSLPGPRLARSLAEGKSLPASLAEAFSVTRVILKSFSIKQFSQDFEKLIDDDEVLPHEGQAAEIEFATTIPTPLKVVHLALQLKLEIERDDGKYKLKTQSGFGAGVGFKKGKAGVSADLLNIFTFEATSPESKRLVKLLVVSLEKMVRSWAESPPGALGPLIEALDAVRDSHLYAIFKKQFNISITGGPSGYYAKQLLSMAATGKADFYDFDPVKLIKSNWKKFAGPIIEWLADMIFQDYSNKFKMKKGEGAESVQEIALVLEAGHDAGISGKFHAGIAKKVETKYGEKDELSSFVHLKLEATLFDVLAGEVELKKSLNDKSGKLNIAVKYTGSPTNVVANQIIHGLLSLIRLASEALNKEPDGDSDDQSGGSKKKKDAVKSMLAAQSGLDRTMAEEGAISTLVSLGLARIGLEVAAEYDFAKGEWEFGISRLEILNIDEVIDGASAFRKTKIKLSKDDDEDEEKSKSGAAAQSPIVIQVRGARVELPLGYTGEESVIPKCRYTTQGFKIPGRGILYNMKLSRVGKRRTFVVREPANHMRGTKAPPDTRKYYGDRPMQLSGRG
ncbi:MAG: DUF4157 domain-containing protein [Myxococcota bacterium]